MKVQVERLRQALKLLQPAVPRKTSLPITTHVKLGEGRAVATDLEVAVTVSGVGESAAGDGVLSLSNEAMCLPYKVLGELLASMPGYETATIALEGKMATIAAGQTQVSLTALPAADFPPVADFTPAHDTAVDGDALVRALSGVLPYVAKDSSRPVLTAVCLTLGDRPEVCGADGFRLAWQPAPKLPGEGNLLVPARAVTVLEHLWRHAPKPPQLEGVTDVVQLAIAKRLVRVEYSLDQPKPTYLLRLSFGEVSLVIRLVEGTFPNYHELIPKHTPSVAFNGADLMLAVRRVAPVARDGSGIIRLSWGDDQLQVKATAEDVGATSTTISARCQREGMIAFNLRYLLEYLEGKDGMVTLATDGPSAPALLSYRGVPHVVLMPMFVQPDETAEAATPSATAEVSPKEEEVAQEPGPSEEEDAPGEPEPAEEELNPVEDQPPVPEPAVASAAGKSRSRHKKQ
ncbi:MAG: DNA polymerase III subunit beta [Chloroflexi bacterium]|nr:DNA polymerase III subunit beta [Chloroflexota bacterium]